MSDEGNIYDRDVISWPETPAEPMPEVKGQAKPAKPAYARKKVPDEEE